MTREEAIKAIKKASEYFGLLPIEFWYDGKYPIGEAIDMAITALKGGDAEMQTIAKTPDYMQETPSEDGSDIISRDEIKALPSAEPKIIKVRKDGTLFVKVLDVSKVHKVEVYDNGDLSKQFGCSADSPTDWTPLRFEDEYKMTSDFPWELDGSWVIVTDGQRVSVERIKKDAYDHFFPNGRYFELEDTIAWMPLPKIINNITESPNDVDETDDEVIEPSDIISRADAKKEVYLLGKNPSINEIWDCLDALPSADRPSGEWIKDYEKNIYKCSVCGCEEVVPTCMGEPTIWKYCPNCGSVIGARMKGGAE